MSADKELILEVQRHVPTDERKHFDRILSDVRAVRGQTGLLDVWNALEVLEAAGDVEKRNDAYQRRTADPIAQRAR